MEKGQILVQYGEDPRSMTKRILERSGLCQMIPSPEATIGIKPNLVVAKPADSGATTHPEVIAALIEYLQEHGFSHLLILEGSWVGDSTVRAYKTCGYTALSQKYQVPLFDTKGDEYERKEAKGISMEISKKALSLDYLINVPLLKGHCQTYVTGALKNMKGILSDQEKRHFHSLGLHRPIAALNTILRGDFVLGDGICGDLDFEEGGNPVPMNRMFCGVDPVLVDSFIASSMGYDPAHIDYIRLAAEYGVGSMDLAHSEILEEGADRSTVTSVSSRKVSQLGQVVSPKSACSACYANLIQALARLEEEGSLSSFRKNLICIGQEYQGTQESTSPGIGHCTCAFAHHVEGCPPRTPAILEFLRNYPEE